MIVFLRILFSLVVVSMIAVITWAGTEVSLFEIPKEVTSHPWFIATLVDAYWAFITFFVWVAWKEQRVLAGVLWFVAIILLGNVAMSAYMLRELFRVPAGGRLADVFTIRNSGALHFPALLVVVAVAVYLIA